MSTKTLLLLLLTTIACLSQFSSDIYAPSLPAITLGLHASFSLVQMTMAIYMFGVAGSMLVYGPLSEGYGRKHPLIIGLIVMLLGSFICLFAANIYMLLAGRFIQGCGAGACASLWRAIFRDHFVGDDLAKYGSYFSMLVTFMVPMAPMLGGYLQEYFNWHGSFIFMTLYVSITLFLVLFLLQESNIHLHKDRLQISYIFTAFLTLLKSRIFMGISLCVFIIYGAFFSSFVESPILLIHEVGISPITFGWFGFAGAGITYGIASFLNGKYVKKFGTNFMLRSAFIIIFVSGLLMLILKFIFGLTAWDIMLPLVIFYFGTTFIWVNAFAQAFSPFGHIAGYAGSLYGFMQIGGGAVISSIISHLPHTNQLSLAMIIIICSFCAWIIYEKFANQK